MTRRYIYAGPFSPCALLASSLSHLCPPAATGGLCCSLTLQFMTIISPAAERLADAGQRLCEQLLRFVADSQSPAQALSLKEMLATFDAYTQAVLICLPPATTWQDNPIPAPVQLLAHREADPLYRLGYVRGYKAGQATASPRPVPLNPEALLQQVRRLLAELQQRYGAGPISYYPARPTA